METEYAFEIGDEGNDHDILNVLFNRQTHAFLKEYLQPGMKVLDIGCATGNMSRWIADRIGLEGHVLGIDNSEKQVKAAIDQTASGIKNVSFKAHSAYDILALKQSFDLVYCRFTLHHVEHPKQVLHHIHEILNPGGIYIGIEGVVDYAFSEPSHPGWQAPPAQTKEDPLDKNIGKRLVNLCRGAGLKVMNTYLYQPLAIETKVKRMLLDNKKAGKSFDLRNGISETEWQQQYQALQACVEDSDIIVGFYGSGFIAAKK